MNGFPTLSLQSEKYSPTGNLAADGFRKLLGAPGVDLLETVIREAVQNICDAAKNGIGPRVRVRLRRLTGEQARLLRENICKELPGPIESVEVFEEYLATDEKWVLEICDFGTTGLAGPTRADVPPEPGETTDFVDFLRNVGSKRDTGGGGGTYGYGKTALYLASRCSTILVDTLTTFREAPTRRFMGCHLGVAYDDQGEGKTFRRTGRHWWGVPGDRDVQEPLVGDVAASLSQQLGLPERSGNDFGSSIMILNPVFLDETDTDPALLMGMIAESFLWHFWPRMMSDVEESKRLNVSLELDGEDYRLPAPEEFPPLDILCTAMKGLRKNDDRVRSIESKRPAKRLGRFRVEKGLRGDRDRLVNPEFSIVPEILHHMAVMRPVELVVRYYEGEPLPSPTVEWGGVFRCDDEDEVENAFASAEPPAHDDWQPKLMPKGNQKTYVNVALREIKAEMNAVVTPGLTHPNEGAGGPSLAQASGQIGKLLGVLSEQGGGSKKKRPSRKSQRRSFQQPDFIGLDLDEHGPVAVFSALVKVSDKDKPLVLVAEPRLVLDGGPVSPTALGVTSPEVIGWSVDDSAIEGGDRVVLNAHEGELLIRVRIPGDCAVSIRLREVDQCPR